MTNLLVVGVRSKQDSFFVQLQTCFLYKQLDEKVEIEEKIAHGDYRNMLQPSIVILSFFSNFFCVWGLCKKEEMFVYVS